ncbi:XdhC family protein [Pseudomonas sp. NPDC089734]|uniref:XdhC family protein n=1 Tax=Pseudomonas sp. NPDC089734 TaxID=3364469 RepID=UPI00380C551E
MKSLDVQVVEDALTWLSAGEPVWLATVTATYGSAPRKPGSMLASTERGTYRGSLSGGCVEEDFLEKVVTGFFAKHNQIVRYGEGGHTPTVALPCGGSLDVLLEYLEPSAINADYLKAIAAALSSNELLCRDVSLSDNSRAIVAATPGTPAIRTTAEQVSILTGASPRVILAGYSPVAAFCGQYAQSMGFEVIVCDPRSDQLQLATEQLPQATHVPVLPALYLSDETCHKRTAVVALTHDPKMDDLTVMEAIRTQAFYIGAMGSLRTSERRKERLGRIGGLNERELERVIAPIGLNLGSKTPPEIALAIMADIVRMNNGVDKARL